MRTLGLSLAAILVTSPLFAQSPPIIHTCAETVRGTSNVLRPGKDCRIHPTWPDGKPGHATPALPLVIDADGRTVGTIVDAVNVIFSIGDGWFYADIEGERFYSPDLSFWYASADCAEDSELSTSCGSPVFGPMNTIIFDESFVGASSLR